MIRRGTPGAALFGLAEPGLDERLALRIPVLKIWATLRLQISAWSDQRVDAAPGAE